jgi:hypothetical protein
LLGIPGTSTSLTNYRTYARRRGTAGKNGAGWNCDVYDIQKTCFWLYFIEYANLNCQATYNAAPDANGYKQGGLGAGVTTLASAAWSTFNAYNPFVPCGYTNSLGNRSGIVAFTMPEEYGSLTVQVPSYRGLENPFGHTWSWTDGVKVRARNDAAGSIAELYVAEDPANFQSNNYNNYQVRGLLSTQVGYIKQIIIGEYGENMPVEVGGSSTTYFCDYYNTYIPALDEAQWGVFFGGSADDGAAAGFGCATTNYAAANSGTHVGSRLCFIPT